MYCNNKGTGENEVQKTWRYGPCTFVMDLLCGDSDTKWLMRAAELGSHIPQLIIHNLDLCLTVARENLNYSFASGCWMSRRAELLRHARHIAVGHTGFRFRKSASTLLAEVKEYVAKSEVRIVVLVKMLALLFFWPCIMNCQYMLITNLMHWSLFIHKIIFSSTCFEPQVLIFRRIQLYTCSIWYCHSLWEFLVACRYTA